MNAFFEQMKAVYDERAEYFQHEHQRLVSFGDMVSDRWEKARKLGFGEGASIYDSALVLGDVAVGESTWIGPQVILDGSGGTLTIGAYCSISAGTHIYTHDSVGWAITGGKKSYATSCVTIGSNVYIGPYAVISRGVSIGNHSIVGTKSFVNKDIPANSVVFGCPARIVGEVALDDSERGYTITYF